MLSGAAKKGNILELGAEICITIISRVENFVYLGVNVDSRLNFEKFINSTVARVNGRLISFARIRNMMDSLTSLTIYKQTILPIIDYLSILVNSSTKRKIKKLQPLQNRAVRIISKRSGYISTEDMNALHLRFRLQHLENRRKMFMLKMMYKLSLKDENLDKYRPDRILRTHPKVKMKVDFTDKERVRRSPYYLGNQLWDKLDVNVQLSKNLLLFGNEIKKIDVSNL